MTLSFVTDSGETKSLRDIGGGAFMLGPDEVCVAMEQGGDRVTCWTLGEQRELVAAGTASKAPSKPATARSRSATAGDAPGNEWGRWVTLNTFVDSIACHLTPSEQSVWLYLFRHCRGGRAEAAMREMAERNGIDIKTASNALRWLAGVGLIEQVEKSRSKGTRSVYVVRLDPARCLDACRDANAPRLARRKGNRRPPVNRGGRKPASIKPR